MWGSIIGDLAGSIYEFNQTKRITNINIKDIISKQAFYSDDTILTVAILDAILNDKNYYKYLKRYGIDYMSYKPDFRPYFKNTFSPNFVNWLKQNGQGYSKGNGAMMRVGPVGYLFNREDEVIENAKLATVCSHNSKEAIECSTIVALIIYYARCGYSKNDILNLLNIKLGYTPFTKFNTTCSKTINNCLYALFNASSFEDSIKKVISYGGDTDTNACIVGSMAEAMYGIDNSLITEAQARIPKSFTKTLKRGYANIEKK